MNFNTALSNVNEPRKATLSLIRSNSEILPSDETKEMKYSAPEDNNREYQELIIPGIPVNGLLVPEGYVVCDSGIFNRKASHHIIPQPVIISERICDTVTDIERLAISFIRGKQWKTCIVNRSIISSRHAIISLANSGLSVNSENAKELIQYLAEFENLNLNRLPYRQSISRAGWVENKEDKTVQFAPYAPNLVFQGESEFQPLFQAIRESGDTDEWIRRICEARSHSFSLRAELAASFASPLMKPLHLQNFFLHLWGPSGTAKSVAVHTAASVWSDPTETIITFNSTPVGMEKFAAFFHDLPLCINERETDRCVKHSDFSKIVYMLTEGVSAARGTRDGGIQPQSNWNLIVLTNGEGPLLSERDKPGMKCRVVELSADKKIFEDAAEMEKFINQNYGGVGKRWIAFLQQQLAQDYGEKMKEQHLLFYNTFARNGIHGRIIQNAATLALADFLTAVQLFGQNENDAMESALKFGEQILASVPNDDEVNLAGRAWEWTLGWCAQHQNKLGKSTFGEQIGDMKGNEIYVISRIYNEAFRDQFGLDPLPVLKDFVHEGHLVSHKQKKTTTVEVAHRIGGIVVKCYQFHTTEDAKDTDNSHREI